MDEEYIRDLLKIFNSGHIYYSTTYDLTLSLQQNALRQAKNSPKDERYLFNQFLQSAFQREDTKYNARAWVLRCILGSVESVPLTSSDKTQDSLVTLLLFRLNCKRLGVRYLCRGINPEGHAANSVEMEQIVFPKNYTENAHISSFVQVRGSVPVFWTQTLDLSYRPKINLSNTQSPASWSSIKQHFHYLTTSYLSSEKAGKVICVNLLDDKGHEGPLTQAYESVVQRLADPRIDYECFPINKWCRKMNFRNMQVLLDRVCDRLTEGGVFHGEGKVPSLVAKKLHLDPNIQVSPMIIHSRQNGVARVSCLDSLDRTNLTCALFARFMIPYQINVLKARGFEKPHDTLSDVSPHMTVVIDHVSHIRVLMEPFTSSFTHIWANAGDSISILYAGTGALKADVTRTGQRQWIRGSVNDGVNALTRYYMGNFTDGRKQDMYDLLTGKAGRLQMEKVVALEGLPKATQASQPILSKTEGIGYLLPGFIVDQVEPFLQHIQRTLTQSKQGSTDLFMWKGADVMKSALSFVVEGIRLYAPHQVTNAFELAVGLMVLIALLVCAKIFQIKGSLLVQKPRYHSVLY
jgi:hypothetical protein